MGIAVGIDLGTTNTVVGVVRAGRASTLVDETGARLIPSVVSFHPSGSVVVGEAAKERRIMDPANTIYSVKRLIGRPWGSAEVQRAISSFPFALQEGPKQSVTVTARGETYTLPEISAFVLRRAKQIAEQSLGETVDGAVITVPANFNDLQRAATKLAGKLAGLEVLRILNEPTAAALAYGQATGERERIAVYDLGGGTFDITLLDLSGKVYEVLSTGGDSSLGGDDFDLLIADRMAQFILENYRIDMHADRTGWAILRSRAEKLKHALSAEEHASIDLNDIAYGERGAALPMTFSMSRAELESLADPLVAQTLDTCRFSLQTIGVKIKDLDRLLLVGGSTRMPLVARTAEEYFQRSAAGRVSPDEVVALGAAIQAFSLNRSQAAAASRKVPTMQVRSSPDSALGPSTLPLVEATRSFVRPPAPPPVEATATLVRPLPPPVETTVTLVRPPPPPQPAPPPPPAIELGGVKRKPPPVPPPRTAAVPEVVPELVPEVAEQEDYSIRLTWAEPPTQKAPPPRAAIWGRPPAADAPSLPPPEAPRAGAPASAAAAPAPAPVAVAPLLIDVTPLSLGVEVAGGFTDVLIAANTPVPCDRARVFRTASDGQTAVVVRVAQGEFEKFDQNTCLGDMELSGIKAEARGEAQIEVVFEIDADGILNVRAKDLGSGRETAAKMRLVGARSDAAEVEQMLSRQQRHPVQ